MLFRLPKKYHANNVDGLYRRRFFRPFRQKSLHLLPNLFTLGNAFFGFCSIVFVAYGEIIAAAYAILLGALMDMLDGRIARYAGSTSDFGVQLDSLCDAITFCLAPAFLAYGWYLKKLGPLGFLVCAFFLLSGLFRLARFNITHANQTIYFLGTPTTIAAITIAMVVLNVQHLFLTSLFVWWVFGMVMALALLMVSRIKFPTMKHMRKKWYAWSAFILIAFALIFGLMKLSLLVLVIYFLCSFEETIRIKFFLRPR